MTVFKGTGVEFKALWTTDGKHKFVLSATRRNYAPNLPVYKEQGDFRIYSLDELTAMYGEVTDVEPVKPLTIKLKEIKNQWHAANAFKKVGLPRLPVITADGLYGELSRSGGGSIVFEFDDSYTVYLLDSRKVVYPLHYLKAVPEGEDG